MRKSTIKIAMYLNYFVFAILLNSVGIVILKAQKNYGVDELQASILEAFKDLPIAIVSFLIASFLPRIGYKRAMLIGLALVSVACVSMYFGNSFGTAKLLFATVGVSFALIKVSVYSLIGTVTDNQQEHNSLMSSIEGVFMIGIAVAYFLFPAFNSEADPDAWLNVYWLLAAISLVSFGFLFFAKFENKTEIPGVDLADDFKQMFKLFAKLLTIVFVISAFLFVMIEQGIMSWLPTFNSKVLHLPENISIMMASILAISLAVGRLLAGVITKKVNWIWVLSSCIVIAMLIVVFVLPKTVGLDVKEINSLSDIPLIGFAFPLVGLFIAPIYPLLNSVVLSALPKKMHSSMTGLIVVFSALGGTLGSRIIGYLFKNEGPEKAFYYTLIPMSLLLVSFFILKKLTSKKMKLLLNIDKVFQALLLQEDTDNDKKITKDDEGPKKFVLQDEKTKQQQVIEGTYHLSNLLQELAMLKESNIQFGEVDLNRIQENPVERISRKIKEDYWDELSRTIDKMGLTQIMEDEKTSNKVPTLYVSAKDKQGVVYFKELEKELRNFKLEILPENYSVEYVDTLNTKPGILALALEQKLYSLQGVPFVVPGGRFNEMYGWDSYFIGVGLLVDNQLEKAMAIAENFKYQIIHYGKILNANRSYYLTRTQPPLYSSLIIDIIKYKAPSLEWLRSHLETVILEYNTVWMVQGNRLTETGLNRYKAEGVGMPFEVEPGHFDDVLEPYAKKYKLPIREFEKKYLERTLVDAELDLYFVHDRSMRESGHDTTNRLINTCANLNSVDVNCFLYKYEKDIAYLIKEYFHNTFQMEEVIYTSEEWEQKALSRKDTINELCWNEESSMYFDYDFVNNKQFPFEAATTFFPLWAKLCDEHQAKKLIEIALPQFIKSGGITGSTEASIANFPKDGPQRQWDYPFGWAPHQMLLWEGLINYNYLDKAQEMVYRWLWLITKNAVEYNGTIPEKFDLEISSHKVFAEYGNVGTEFDYIAKEGFGWVNASYQYGLRILDDNLKQELNKLTAPDELF